MNLVLFIVLIISIILQQCIYVHGKDVSTQKITEFGCTFDDDGYNLNSANWKSRWPIDPVYGEQREGALFFNDDVEFGKFYEKLETIRKNLFKSAKYVYNTVEDFSKFYEDYSITKNKSFRSFFKNYVPKFPSLNEKAPGNSWNGLIWIYKDLVKYDKRVQKYFTMAACDRKVRRNEIDSLVSGYGSKPPSWFQHENMAGKATGWVPEVSVQFVLRKKSNALPSYIQVNLTQLSYYKDYIQYDVIFIGKSLCSFASIEKAALLNPKREIVQRDERGNLIASVLVYLKPGETNNVWMNLNNIAKFYYQVENVTLNMFKEGYSHPLLDKIISHMEISKGQVYHQLSVLNKIQTKDEAFIKDLTEWYRIIVLPYQTAFSGLINRMKVKAYMN